MTILVGVRCTDGVVIGADSKATSAMGREHLLQLQSNDKLQLIGNKIILAATGAVGFGQRLKVIADKMWADRKFSGGGMKCATELAGLMMKDLQSSLAQSTPQHGLGFGALLAGVIEKEPYLIEFGTVDFQPEIKQDKIFFGSMGSGQRLADPFLAFVSRVLWNDTMPDVETAKIGVLWTLQHTIRYAPGGVGDPIKLGVISKVGADWVASILDDQDTQEQSQYIEELESKIGAKDPIEDAPASSPPTLDADNGGIPREERR